MYRYSQIPTLVNLQFVPQTFDLPEQYHYQPIDKEWFQQNLRTWQFQRPYLQPVQQSDKQYLELHINNIDGIVGFDSVYYIINSNGVAVTGNINPDYLIFGSGSSYVTDDGTVIPMAVCKWNFRFSDYSLPNGVYHLVIRNRFYDNGSPTPNETRLWLSEPLLVKTNHPNTVYIQGWSNTNTENDVIFQYNGGAQSGIEFYTPKFGLRIAGDIDYNPSTTRDAINFIEQDDQTRQLSVEGQPKAKLYIGGNHGVPFYMRNKANELFKCDNVYVENRRKTVVDGADWEVTGDENALTKAVIELTDYKSTDWFTDTKGAAVQLFIIPAYPFYVFIITLEQAGNITYGRYITDDTTRDAYLAYLNNTVLDLHNQEGEYAIQDGSFVYINGDNENEQLQYALIETQYFDMTVVTSAPNQTFKFYFNKAVSGFVWGDGNYTNVVETDGTSATSYNRAHTYTSAGTYTMRIFHDDTTMTKFAILGGQFTGSLQGQIIGNVPVNLAECNIRFNPNLGTSHSFNLGFLARCSLSIVSINVSTNGLTAIGDMVFLSKPWTFLQPNWLLLTTYSNSNALSVSEVNGVIQDFFIRTPKYYQGFLDVRQTPPATPTGLALSQANQLVSFYGWFVQRD